MKLLPVITLLLLSILQQTTTDSNVGCLFSKRVCRKSEWCFDDFAFGRCVSRNKETVKGDFYRYELAKDSLIALEKEMRMLFFAGYRWTHGYTQCVVKNILNAFRFRTDYKRESCGHKEDEDLERALEMLEAGEAVDPKDLAIIKFTPSAGDTNAEFGDEIYFPPLDKYSGNNDDGSYVGVVKKYPSGVQQPYELSQHKGKVKQVKNKHNDMLVKPKRFHVSDYDVDYVNILPFTNEMDKESDDEKQVFSRQDEDEWSFSKRKLKSSRKPHSLNSIFVVDNVFNDENDEDEFANINRRMDTDLAFTRPYRYDVKKPGPFFNVNNYFFQKEKEEVADDSNGSDLTIFRHHPLFDGDSSSYDSPSVGHYQQKIEIDLDKGRKMKVNATLPGEHNSGANVDATTPGEYPLYLQHPSSAAKTGTEAKSLNRRKWRNKASLPVISRIAESMEESAQTPIQRKWPDASEELLGNDESEDKSFYDKRRTPYSADFEAPQLLPHRQESKVVSVGPSEDPNQYDVVDTSYAFLTVDKGFETWEDAKHFVEILEKLLKLRPRTFSNIRQDENQVTFKVENNDNGWNASTIANKAESLKWALKERTGKTLTRAGIGDKTKIPVATLESDNRLVVITFLVCGSIAGFLIAVGVLYVVKRHARSREKLQTLTQPDTEASHDYQDLCRQRMASKTNEKQEPIHAVQRISSLSRESETSTKSPSSRSSTSSWPERSGNVALPGKMMSEGPGCEDEVNTTGTTAPIKNRNEEPVVSNMDISTGHMVLSYMEDHLTNKDRLEQEWVALCAYEADPAIMNCSLLANNIRKNRYEDVLPFDHSRVVLNDLANIGGCDYINASTITDHDPRNPAYIATQGPLPHTSADFWQMIWEQGSVVIVMLTRLVENGMAMCHRYWPEEGSELYHIYEVHLVSEHIWCEDYLVRSLYLKNLRTGETRTVTQFHFMSWSDNGVPASIKALLEFRRKVNKSYRGRSCPIAVHCSDGVGRAGTYCLIDMVLNRMAKGTKEIDIAATLEHIRDQRAGMVKTKAQFEFALMAVAEEVHAILRALPQ